jgi:aromatic ring-opening dioxygenase catalytic subunit (LigB family)
MASLSISAHLDTLEQGGCRPKAVIASSAHSDVFHPVMKAMSRNSPIHEFYGHSQKLYQVCSADCCVSCNDLVL